MNSSFSLKGIGIQQNRTNSQGYLSLMYFIPESRKKYIDAHVMIDRASVRAVTSAGDSFKANFTTKDANYLKARFPCLIEINFLRITIRVSTDK
jgi:hypothetical protein